MEVENVGRDTDVSSVADKKNKKKIIIFASVFAVVVIGLVIAIVVVLNNRDNNVSQEQEKVEENVLSEDEAVNLYDEIAGEIAAKIAELTGDVAEEEREIDMQIVLDMYKEKIDTIDNTRARAFLMIDYCMARIAQNPNPDIKDEVLNNLIEADIVLQSPTSAMAIVNAALYYEDEALSEKYNKIADERFAEINDVEDVNYDDEETAR